MDIRIGDFEVLSSGCVTSFNNLDALFVITDAIKVRIHFLSDDSNSQTMNASINDSRELQINLSNFNNPLGTEFTNPFEVGTLSGRRLLLHVKVLGMSSSNNRTIIYTWLLGGAINNG